MLELPGVMVDSGVPAKEVIATEVDILFEEYRVLYGLVLFRLTSLDRRVPVAGATLAAFLSSVAALPYQSQLIVLVGLPLAAMWFLRTTINHARSLEDAFRRIEEIERKVNKLMDRQVLRFQSSHPSRGRFVGGRTGNETIASVLVSAGTILGGCGYLFYQIVSNSPAMVSCFMAYALVVACCMVGVTWRLGRYQYSSNLGT